MVKRSFAGSSPPPTWSSKTFAPESWIGSGSGYSALKKIKPNIVYCAISGFGQNGPLKDNPAYDQIVQGLSGVMSITGDKDSAPLRAGFPVADTIGGLTAAFAIAAALFRRQRITKANSSTCRCSNRPWSQWVGPFRTG